VIVGALAVAAILFLVLRRRTAAPAAGPIDDASWSGEAVPPVASAPAIAPVEGSGSTAPVPVDTPPPPPPPTTDETSPQPEESSDEEQEPPPSTTG
jgi:hypothetical protein